MKGFVVRYFSLLFLLMAIGIDVFGNMDFQEKVSVTDELQVENVSNDFQVCATPIDRHGAFERSLTFSHQQVTYGSSREQFSLSFYRLVQLASHRVVFRVLHVNPYESFSDLLGIRHLQGFYVFDLCKIIV